MNNIMVMFAKKYLLLNLLMSGAKILDLPKTLFLFFLCVFVVKSQTDLMTKTSGARCDAFLCRPSLANQSYTMWRWKLNKDVGNDKIHRLFHKKTHTFRLSETDSIHIEIPWIPGDSDTFSVARETDPYFEEYITYISLYISLVSIPDCIPGRERHDFLVRGSAGPETREASYFIVDRSGLRAVGGQLVSPTMEKVSSSLVFQRDNSIRSESGQSEYFYSLVYSIHRGEDRLDNAGRSHSMNRQRKLPPRLEWQIDPMTLKQFSQVDLTLLRHPDAEDSIVEENYGLESVRLGYLVYQDLGDFSLLACRSLENGDDCTEASRNQIATYGSLANTTCIADDLVLVEEKNRLPADVLRDVELYVLPRLTAIGVLGGSGNTSVPTKYPTRKPSIRPTRRPTKTPTVSPTTPSPASRSPTMSPTKYVPGAPTTQPVTQSPTRQPVFPPTRRPTKSPTSRPSVNPTPAPSTKEPTQEPTIASTPDPTVRPTPSPSAVPTLAPTYKPGAPTPVPTLSPTAFPSVQPTMVPSALPTLRPSAIPSIPPSGVPTSVPTTSKPSTSPTPTPTAQPSMPPTAFPTAMPTVNPTAAPSVPPTHVPTYLPGVPTPIPTLAPSFVPSITPTAIPSVIPSSVPSVTPTKTPTTEPSTKPSLSPSLSPTISPTLSPTAAPSVPPTLAPTYLPGLPTPIPTLAPSCLPSVVPSPKPSSTPSTAPTSPSPAPSVAPSYTPGVPTPKPSVTPSPAPTAEPTSASPTSAPSPRPTQRPVRQPTYSPSAQPTLAPTYLPGAPTPLPSVSPTYNPSSKPTAKPSTAKPSLGPTPSPTSQISVMLMALQTLSGISAQVFRVNISDNSAIFTLAVEQVVGGGNATITSISALTGRRLLAGPAQKSSVQIQYQVLMANIGVLGVSSPEAAYGVMYTALMGATRSGQFTKAIRGLSAQYGVRALANVTVTDINIIPYPKAAAQSSDAQSSDSLYMSWPLYARILFPAGCIIVGLIVLGLVISYFMPGLRAHLFAHVPSRTPLFVHEMLKRTRDMRLSLGGGGATNPLALLFGHRLLDSAESRGTNKRLNDYVDNEGKRGDNLDERVLLSNNSESSTHKGAGPKKVTGDFDSLF